MIRRLLSWFHRKRQERLDAVMAERQVVVGLSDTGISATYPDGTIEAINWTDVIRIAIETNDSGPWGADVWWSIEGASNRCTYPLGATGDSEALAQYPKRFPGFSDEKVIEAMGCTGNARFLCWENADASHEPIEHGQTESLPTQEGLPLPRWVQICIGTLLLPLVVLCMIGAITIFGIPKVQSDPFLQLVAAIICLLALWAVVLVVRLVFGLRGRFGLMGPVALRITAIVAIGLVIGGAFTDVYVEHPVRSAVMALAYISIAIQLWRLASERSRRAV